VPSSRRSGKRPYAAEHRPLDLERATGGRSSESAADGEWVVQRVRGSSSTYRCPGCDQTIEPGTAHVVAWRSDALLGDGLDDRRHWHAACWSARARRGPTRR
jgi:hypothetical protein